MALTNVAMWTNKGWKSVTVDEAISLFPYNKVSANSGIFMCRLCKKYVTLTAPGIYSRCFKHSRGDVDKECNDRVLSSTISQFEMHNFIPPNKYVMVRSAAMISPIHIFSKWIMYCIQSGMIQEQIRNKTKTTAQSNLFQEAIRSLILPIPPSPSRNE